MSHKKDEFQKLQAQWYKKLEEDGFKDIEQADGKLKTWSSRFVHDRVQELGEEREPYYALCTQFLNEHLFDNRFEQIIWEYHTNGLSSKEIAKVFEKAKVYKTNYQTVWLITKKLEKIMKKLYLPSWHHE